MEPDKKTADSKDVRLFTPHNFGFLYDNMDVKKFAKMKGHFAYNLKLWAEYEKYECAKKNMKPEFTDQDGKHIMDMLGKCKDYYELEALKKCVLEYNQIPDNYNQIKKAASLLRNQ